MVADNYQRGDLLPVVLVPDGQPAVTVSIKGWNSDREVLTFDVTSTRHLGETARIAGKRDGRGNVTACFDLDLPPYASSPNIREGAKAVIREYVSPSVFIQTPILIKKVHYESAVEQELRWNFDWEYSILSGQHIIPS